jgi:hypothetical protein
MLVKRIGKIALAVMLLVIASARLNIYADDNPQKIVFVVDHNAVFKLYDKPTHITEGDIHYVPFTEIEPEKVVEGTWLSGKGDEHIYDKYIYEVSEERWGHYSFRVSEPGKVTQAGWIRSEQINNPDDPSDFHDLTNPDGINNDDRVEYDVSKTVDRVYYDDGIVTNANKDGSSSIDLDIGEEFQLKAYRTWQIVDTAAGNYFIEPDFHYSLVQGDSVDLSESGHIRAVKNGVSIIRVTYDEIMVGYLGALTKYNAIDPVCVGIVVVNVGGGDNTSLNTGISLTEYDTVYYSRKITFPTGNVDETGNNYAEYSFKPDEGSTVKVLPPPDTGNSINGPWTTEWTTYQPDGEGEYKIRLYDGKNIVCIDKDGISKYHVVRACGLDVTLRNKTSDNEPLMVGDTVEIHFDNLYLPVPKMAAVYNPGSFSYTSTVFPRLQYKMNGSIYQGYQVYQYNLRNDNKLEIEMEDSGLITLTDGCINEPYMGSPGVTHYNIPESGLTRNFSAVTIPNNYSVLPDIELEVYDKSAVPEGKRNRVKKIISPAPENISTSTAPVATNKIRMNYGDGIGGIYSKDISSAYIFDADLKQSSMVEVPNRRSFPLKGTCYDSDSKVVFRYWKDGSTDYYYESSDRSSFDFSGNQLKVNGNTFENAELIIIPGDTRYSNYTYAFKVYPSVSALYTADVLPGLMNIETVASNGSEYYDEHDGELKADNIVLQADDGTEKEVDLGYGFLCTETHYSMSLPDSTSEIAFNLVWHRLSSGGTNEYTSAELTIEGNDSFSQSFKGPELRADNLTITDGIPLNENGDTIIHVKMTTTISGLEDLSSDYVITVKKHSDVSKKQVSFDCKLDGTKVTVNRNGRKISPDENGNYYLKDGEYDYLASCPGYSSLRDSFVVDTNEQGEQIIEVPALEGPRNVTFQCTTAGTEIFVKDAKKKLMVSENGVYSLIGGDTYTWYASCQGYLTMKDSFTVGDESDQIVEIPALTEVSSFPRGSKVSVTIVGDEKKLISDYAVPMNISQEDADLVTGKNYVEYNLGTFTALHALIYTLDDNEGLDYNCHRGKLKVITDMAGTYPDGSWQCEVNGVPVEEPALYPLNPDDQVLLYYSKGYQGMTHAFFKNPVVEVTEGDTADLILYGHRVGQGSDESVIAGATVYVNRKAAGTTDASGCIHLKNLTMAGGPYVVTAEKKNTQGKNILTWNQCMVSVQSKTEGISGSRTARFRLIGDSKHGDAEHGSYQTWIATEEIPLNSGTNTVYDIFMKAVNCAGLAQDGAEDGYIRMVQAPASLGGTKLREFDNGSGSGWMYTLNGIHPQFGVKEQEVKEGDIIVFHYVDNFHIEENNYSWLEAADINPEGIHPYVIQNTVNLIHALPAVSKLTLKDKTAVEEAQKVYDSLTADQKKQVDTLDNGALDKLTSAVTKMDQLVKEEAEKARTVPVKKGTKFTVKGYKYTVTSNLKKKPTVTVTGYKNKKLKKIIVPATVTYKKVTFKITTIGKNAFKKQKIAVAAVIGGNVETIGQAAFAGDKKLKKIIVQSLDLKAVGPKAVKGIYKKARIKVPAKKIKAYRKLFNKKGQAKTVKIVK